MTRVTANFCTQYYLLQLSQATVSSFSHGARGPTTDQLWL